MASATFRYVAFFDLLADAAFQHQLAVDAPDSYAMSRHARASVIASALSIECVANCLVESIDGSKGLRKDLDKLPPLSKIETALRLTGVTSFDRGRDEVQKATDLVRARNDYVHPKTASIEVNVSEPQDAGNEWMIPFVIQGEQWQSLGIPKQAMFWSQESALAALNVVSGFYRYLFVELMSAQDEQLHRMLPCRLEVGNVLMPAVFDEYKRQLAVAAKHGVDFSFLGALVERT
jgi:hypothetical protein